MVFYVYTEVNFLIIFMMFRFSVPWYFTRCTSNKTYLRPSSSFLRDSFNTEATLDLLLICSFPSLVRSVSLVSILFWDSTLPGTDRVSSFPPRIFRLSRRRGRGWLWEWCLVQSRRLNFRKSPKGNVTICLL